MCPLLLSLSFFGRVRLRRRLVLVPQSESVTLFEIYNLALAPMLDPSLYPTCLQLSRTVFSIVFSSSSSHSRPSCCYC